MKHDNSFCTASVREPSYFHHHDCDMRHQSPESNSPKEFCNCEKPYPATLEEDPMAIGRCEICGKRLHPTKDMGWESFATELRKWWSFDENQQHTHNWHSREDFIEQKLPQLIAQAEERGRNAAVEYIKTAHLEIFNAKTGLMDGGRMISLVSEDACVKVKDLMEVLESARHPEGDKGKGV